MKYSIRQVDGVFRAFYFVSVKVRASYVTNVNLNAGLMYSRQKYRNFDFCPKGVYGFPNTVSVHCDECHFKCLVSSLFVCQMTLHRSQCLLAVGVKQ